MINLAYFTKILKKIKIKINKYNLLSILIGIIVIINYNFNYVLANNASHNTNMVMLTNSNSNYNNIMLLTNLEENNLEEDKKDFNSQTIIWLILAILFIALEINTLTLTSLWFAFGSIVTMACTSFTNSTFLQFSIFLSSSLAFIIALKPITKKYIHTEKVATNVDRIISMIGIVLEDVDWNSGEVKVDGKIWSARTDSPDILLKKGTKVEILKIQGVKLIVREEREIKNKEKIKI